MAKLTKTDRRKYRFCSIAELENLHDDAVECGDFEWAAKIDAELRARGWKPPVPPAPPAEPSEMPF